MNTDSTTGGHIPFGLDPEFEQALAAYLYVRGLGPDASEDCKRTIIWEAINAWSLAVQQRKRLAGRDVHPDFIIRATVNAAIDVVAPDLPAGPRDDVISQLLNGSPHTVQPTDEEFNFKSFILVILAVLQIVVSTYGVYVTADTAQYQTELMEQQIEILHSIEEQGRPGRGES